MKECPVPAIMVATVVLIVSGCVPRSSQPGPEPLPPSSLEATSAGNALIEVPDVLRAVASHRFPSSYSVDPKTMPAEIAEYVRNLVESTGLVADVTVLSPELEGEGTQSPAPGLRVPAETTVTVHIYLDE